MKRFLIRIVVFAAIFFVIEKVSYVLLEKAPSREYDKRLQTIIEGKMNKDIVILGSSRGAGNVLAGQIENELNLKTYNLSYQGSNIIFQEFILKTLLKYNKKPKKVLLVVDNPYVFLSGNALAFRHDVLKPLAKDNYINNQLIKVGHHNLFSKVLYTARINKYAFNFKPKTAPTMNPLDAYGTMPLNISKTDILEYSNTVKPYSKNDESLDKLDAFRAIQQLCIENSIELNYVFSPSFRRFNNSFLKRFYNMTDKNEHVFIFDTLNPIYKDKANFYDNAHLNVKGAKIFTSELSLFLSQR